MPNGAVLSGGGCLSRTSHRQLNMTIVPPPRGLSRRGPITAAFDGPSVAAKPRTGEGRALAWAFAAHVGLLALLSFAWRSAPPMPPVVEATPVEIIDVSDLPTVTELPRPSIAAAPQETIQATEPDPGEAARIDVPPPPEPVIQPLDLPVPELRPQVAKTSAKPKPRAAPSELLEAEKPQPPKAEGPKPAAEKATPVKAEAPKPIVKKDIEAPKPVVKKEATETSKPAVDAKPQPSKLPADPPTTTEQKTAKPTPEATSAASKVKPGPQRLDAQDLANLLDKTLPKAKRKPLDTSDLANSIERAQPRAKLDSRATAALVQAIQAQIYPCWNPPMGSAAQGGAKVIISAEFSRDGSNARPPRIAEIKSADPAYGRLTAESARRAVIRCAPLTLPGELFDAWREVDLVFDPSDLG